MIRKPEFDKTAFEMRSSKEMKPAINYWKDKTPEERLEAACYLNSVAYNFDINNPPKMDKTVFSMRKHKA
jgi:hypothetical protein